MYDEIHCEHCTKLLISVAPGRLTTHGPMSIRSSFQDGQRWVECPQCGRDSVVSLERRQLLKLV